MLSLINLRISLYFVDYDKLGVCSKNIGIVITGVSKVDIDTQKDLVTVKGTMDAKALQPYLKEKLKRGVEIVPPKKDGDKKEGEKGFKR